MADKSSILSSFLIDGKCRFWRYVFFIIAGAVITSSMVFVAYMDCAAQLGNRIYLICLSSCICYAVAMLLNYHYLIPKFLLKGRYVVYSILIFIAAYLLPTLSIAQEYFVRNTWGLPHRITSYTNPLIWVDNLSSCMMLLICFLGVSAIMLFRQWKNQEEQLTLMEHKYLRMEVNRLKEQIDPSYLSETLLSIAALIKTNAHKANETLMQLAQLLRHKLYDYQKDRIAPDEEINTQFEASITPDRLSSFLIDDKYRIYRHLIMQVFILIISIGNFFDAPDKINLSANRVYGWLGYYVFLNVLVYFNVYVLYPRFLAKKKLALYILSVVAFTIAMGVVMMWLQDQFYDIAVIHQEPTAAAIILNITSSILAMALFIGGIAALLSLKQWMTNKHRMVHLKAATSESELKYLKSQINPHFLFNMLNNANILIEDEPEKATDILQNLDKLLQYQLGGSLQEKVKLNDDIRFLSHFLELEKTRRDQFEYMISIEGDTDNAEVAPLLFIPFVENAVKHNADSKNGSFVHILFCLQDGRLTFTCSNSVSENTAPPKEKGGLGLTNIKRRLDLLFGENYSLEQTKTDSIYTATLQIKL